MLALAIAAAIAASQHAADPAAAEIVKLEQQWGEAFVKRDFDLIERIIAPEYRLVVAFENGSFSITLRPEWMKNAVPSITRRSPSRRST